MNREIVVTVEVDGLAMHSTISSSALADPRMGEVRLAEAIKLEVSGMAFKLLGPRTGCASFSVGDRVVHQDGRKGVVFRIDRATQKFASSPDRESDEPIEGWRPLWTIPEAERS